jgi:hypothetical protein
MNSLRSLFFLLVGFVIMGEVSSNALASIQAGIFNTSGNTIEVRAKSDANITAGLLSNVVVTLKWDATYGVDLGPVVSGNMTTGQSIGMAKDGGEVTSGSFEYQIVNAFPTAGSITWTAGVEYVLFTTTLTGGTGTGTIAIVNDAYTFGANGDCYFEIGGGDATNASPFYQGTATGVPLPVELVSFTASARGRNIDLSWATKTEVNNYGFDVERKAINNQKSTPPQADAPMAQINSWKKVGFVEGKGTTNAPQNYGYKDVVKSAGTFAYRLKQTDRDGKFTYSTQVEAKAMLTADDYKMSLNYPNPFNPSTKFNFAVSTPQHVSVKVFNSVGQEVQTLFNDIAPADQIQEVTFDGARLASGIYFYVLRAQDRAEVKKMLLLK